MTIPKIIVTIEGGVIQSVLVSHQVEVFFIDRDTEGVDDADVSSVAGGPALVSRWYSFPSPADDQALATAMAEIEAQGFKVWTPQ
jgi:hypothetical protein